MAAAIACDQVIAHLVDEAVASLVKEELADINTEKHGELQQGCSKLSLVADTVDSSTCQEDAVMNNALEPAAQAAVLSDAELQQLEAEEAAIEQELFRANIARELQLAAQQRALEIAVQSAHIEMAETDSQLQLQPPASQQDDLTSVDAQISSAQIGDSQSMSSNSLFIGDNFHVETGTVQAGQPPPPLLDLPRVDSQTLLARAEAIDSPVGSAHRLAPDCEVCAVGSVQSTRDSPDLSIAHSIPVADDITRNVELCAKDEPAIVTVDSFNFSVAVSGDELDSSSFNHQQKERSAAIAEQLAQLQEESRKLQQQNLKLQERADVIHREALQSGVPANLLAPFVQHPPGSIAPWPAAKLNNANFPPVPSNITPKSHIPCAPAVSSNQATNTHQTALQSPAQHQRHIEVVVPDTVEQSNTSKPLRAGLKWQVPQQHKAGTAALTPSPTKCARTPETVQVSNAHHSGHAYEQVSLRRENSSSSTVEPMLPRWSDQLASTNTSPVHSPDKFRRWESPLKTHPSPDMRNKLQPATSGNQGLGAPQPSKQQLTSRQQQPVQAQPRKFLPEVRLPVIAKQAAQYQPSQQPSPASYGFGQHAGVTHYQTGQTPAPVALMGLQTQYPNNPMAMPIHQLWNQPIPAAPLHNHTTPQEVFVNPAMYSQPSMMQQPIASQNPSQLSPNPKPVHRPVPQKPGPVKQQNKAGRTRAGQPHGKTVEAQTRTAGQQKPLHQLLPPIHQPTGFGAESSIPDMSMKHQYQQPPPPPPPYPYQAVHQPSWPSTHMPPDHSYMQQGGAAHNVQFNPAWQGQQQGLMNPAMLPYQGAGYPWFPNTQQVGYLPPMQQAYTQQVAWNSQPQAPGMLQGPPPQDRVVAHKGTTNAVKQAQQKAGSKKTPGFRTY